MERVRLKKLVDIYVLFDPRYPTVIRYVGKSNSFKQRLYGHRDPGRHNKAPVSNWSRSLLRQGILVEGKVIERVEDWEEAERRWIRHYRRTSPKLLNVEDGGVSSWAEGNKYKRDWKPRKPWFRKVVQKVNYIIWKEKKENPVKAQFLRFCYDQICYQRDCINETLGPDAMDQFDYELCANLLPLQVMSKEERKRVLMQACAKSKFNSIDLSSRI